MATNIKSYDFKLPPIRLVLLYLIVLSPSMGTALSAVGRLLLFILTLGVIIFDRHNKENSLDARRNSCAVTVLIAVAYMAMTLLWSEASDEIALKAWARHARILTIPMVYLLIYNYTEARSVLRVFVIGQTFVVLSAWLMVWGIHVPWATAKSGVATYAVFGSYLEQSISQAVLVALLWHQRNWIFGVNGKWLAITLAATTLLHTLNYLIGRSGHLVAVAMVILAIIYVLPKRFKLVAVLIPFVVLALVFVGSQNFRDRANLVRSEINAFSNTANTTTSSGERLLFWKLSLVAIQEDPLYGHGSGSWNKSYRRLEAGKANPSTLTVDNPHQLFLLWAVEGGVIGLIVLCAVFTELYLCSIKLAPDDARTLQSVIVALIVSGMLNSQIFGIGMGDYFCVAFGICLALIHGRHLRSARPAHG